LDAAGVKDGDRVLDVGCGTGLVARAAVPCVGPTGAVVGLDPNDGMLAVARQSSAAVDWRPGVAEDLPFRDGTFDGVVSQFAVMFFEHADRAVSEMARVLAPSGRVAVATWAAVEESPGYAAMVELLEGVIGADAAAALRAPFRLGSADVVTALLAPHVDDVEVNRHEGTARFDTLDAWLHTEIRGWTLADRIDDEQFERLTQAARVDLARVVRRDGSVSFPAPALVGSGRAA